MCKIIAMENVPRHRETVQFILEILKDQKRKEISRQEIVDLIREKNNVVSNYTISSAIREFVRHGVFIRKKFKLEYRYLIKTSEINKLAKILRAMKKAPKGMKNIQEIISKFNTLSRREIDALLPMYSVIDIDRIIVNLQKLGFIAKFHGKKTRGKYIVQPEPGQEQFLTDPIRAAVSIFRKNILFCYNTALELHGLSRYGMSFVLYIHGYLPQDLPPLGDVAIKSVKIRSPEKGKTSLKRVETVIYLTDLERTIIDCIHRPKYAVGWENVLYALRRLEQLNGNRILEYLKAICIPSLFAKMGVVLEYFQEDWKIHNNILNNIQMFCPSSPVRFSRNDPGCINKRWNIYVPEGLFEGF